MIARLWRGRVPAEKSLAYLALMRDVAVPDYCATPGNQGAWCLHRELGESVEVQMMSFWDSLESIAAFAGAEIARARYYDFDPDYLVEMPRTVDHYEIG